MALTPQDPHKAAITSVGSAIGGGTASSSKPVITGTADAGTTVDIFDGVRMIGTALVAADGTWSFTPTADLKAGSHSFTAISIDSNGDMGASSTPMSVKVPVPVPVGPPTPIIDGGGPTDDQGHPLSDPTSNPRPEMSGTGTPGDTITMYDGNTPIGSTVIDGTGHWDVKPEKDLGPGDHDIYVIETNPAGVPSQPSDHYPVVIDTSVPAAPVVTGLTDDNGVAIPNGASTPDGRPTMSGTGTPGDIVKMYDGQEVIGSAKVDADGKWSITPTKDLPDAAHDLYAIETNAAGTSGPTSDHFIITVDSNMPATPVEPTMKDDTGAIIPSDSITNDPHPQIDGKGTAGDTITVYDNGVVIGSTTVAEDGTWSFTPSPDLGPGEHEIVVIETNPAGTPSNPSEPIYVVIDTGIPSAPVVTGITDDNGIAIPNGGATPDAHPTLSGTGTPGDIVRMYDGQEVIGSTMVDWKGDWSITPTKNLSDGSHDLYAIQTNEAGTSGPTSEHFLITVDTSMPATPVEPTMTDDSGAAIPAGGTTADPHPHIDGKGTAGDTITVYDNGDVIGSTTVAQDGTWSFTPSPDLGPGNHDIVVIETNPAGIDDGKQQLIVNGKEGDSVDLTNSHVAGLAEGDWHHHGTAEVGGVLYNVVEHSTANTELLVEHAVRIEMH
jgi:hypothetical protein